MPSSGLFEGLTLLAENTGLVVGRTLVDPSRWRVPVLTSNFSQDTVMVEPFSKVDMVAQISAIQSVTDHLCRPQCGAESLPLHLRDVNCRMSCCNIRIYSLFPDHLLPAIQMRWNKRLIQAMIRQYTVHPAGCRLKR